ncbi:hypothetical protein GCM10007028_01620 [Algibacter mikhailovii]|uniref:Uncharacterized protein n=1 Tax=Algibacter mikhailovii TaxID=425498 RepID=A0A918V4B7_9FLAO|nr:hypothetical protein GCM10007028_01620 [Algibacter mikhailovii]
MPFIKPFTKKHNINNMVPTMIGSMPPNVNNIPITNPNRYSGKCTGLKKAIRTGARI